MTQLMLLLRMLEDQGKMLTAESDFLYSFNVDEMTEENLLREHWVDETIKEVNRAYERPDEPKDFLNDHVTVTFVGD